MNEKVKLQQLVDVKTKTSKRISSVEKTGKAIKMQLCEKWSMLN